MLQSLKKRRLRKKAAKLASDTKLILERERTIAEFRSFHAIKLNLLKEDRKKWIAKGMSEQRADAKYNAEVAKTNAALETLISATNGEGLTPNKGDEKENAR